LKASSLSRVSCWRWPSLRRDRLMIARFFSCSVSSSTSLLSPAAVSAPTCPGPSNTNRAHRQGRRETGAQGGPDGGAGERRRGRRATAPALRLVPPSGPPTKLAHWRTGGARRLVHGSLGHDCPGAPRRLPQTAIQETACSACVPIRGWRRAYLILY